MNAQLQYTMVQHRSAELRRAGERTRIAAELRRGAVALQTKRAVRRAR
jgi:hypothetical protein